MTETEILEYKESLTQLKKAVISISSILNKHKKGKIMFGAKDNGVIKGVSVGKTTLRDISKTISDHIEPKIYPEIKEEVIEGKKCISIIFSGEDIPYFAYGKAYKRVSDEDKILTKGELEKMFLSNKKNIWDAKTSSEFNLKDISDKKLKEYVRKTGLDYSSKEKVLENLGLFKHEKLTNASILLFGNESFKYFKLLNLRCAVFSGIDKSSSFIDMKDYSGDIFELIQLAQQYILQHINVGMKIEELQRVDVPEIDVIAIREAIINAFCHRDYTINQEIQIAIFKDRVEILSPGGLIEGLNIKDILSKKISKRRNELISDIFHRVHYVEKWGTGISKIKELEPETLFEEISEFFMVTFKRKKLKESTNMIEPLNEPLNEPLKIDIILDYIKKNPGSNRKNIVNRTQIPLGTVKRHLKQLINEYKIERIGSDKTGGYYAK